MNELILKTATAQSVIHCGAGAFEKYAKNLKGRQLFVVTDENVNALYRKLIQRVLGDCDVMVLPAGEATKCTDNLLRILKSMLESGMRRNGTVVAIGGGVIGDIAGLAAALYMRGVRLVQIPTTLLAQTDSSVGGKTAVDMCRVKNVLGAFYQPEEVIADPLFFATLPPREIDCGLGEIVKYGALDKDIFQKLLKNIGNLKSHVFLEQIVFDCINYKAKVVKADERDLGGERKVLNLGHTTGHALELYYGEKPHGVYVLIGMYYELQIARKLGICGGQYAEYIEKLISAVIGKAPSYKDIQNAAAFAVHDKKNEDEKISLIVPKSEGECKEIKLDFNEYVNYLKEVAKSL